MRARSFGKVHCLQKVSLYKSASKVVLEVSVCKVPSCELCVEWNMASLAGTYAALRILFSYGPGFLMLMLLDSSIWMQRPDIVDYKNRVRDIPTQHIYSVYDFVS